MNPLIISCSRCDYFFSSNSEFDYKYKINNEEFIVQKSYAWCFLCKKIVFAESFPSIKNLANHYAELLKIRESIKLQIEINKNRHPILSLINKKIYDDEGELLNLELTEAARSFLMENLLTLAANLNLDRQPRCLDCFSSDIQYLNVDFSKLKIPTEDENLPIKMGMNHFGCDGELEISYSPVRIYRSVRDTVYLSSDGFLL